VTYVGDGNNIVHSWIRLAAKFDFEFVCACPEGFEPDAATMELANAAGAGRVSVSHEPFEVRLRACARATLELAQPGPASHGRMGERGFVRPCMGSSLHTRPLYVPSPAVPRARGRLGRACASATRANSGRWQGPCVMATGYRVSQHWQHRSRLHAAAGGEGRGRGVHGRLGVDGPEGGGRGAAAALCGLSGARRGRPAPGPACPAGGAGAAARARCQQPGGAL